MNELAHLKDKLRTVEKRLIQSERALSLLKELSLFFSSDMQSTLDLFAYRMGVLTDAKFVRVYFADKSAAKLRLVSGFNLSDKYLEMVKNKLEISTESVPFGKAVSERAPYVVNDVRVDDAFSAWSEIAAMHGYLSYVALPLIASDRILGAVDIFFESVRYFSEDELNLMSVLANAGALAIENALLLERIGHISIVDEDTGAYNYRHFVETLKREIERANRYGQPLTLIMMRVSKKGHELDPTPPVDRNEFLRLLVSDAKKKVRGSDMLFRYGDDLFCLILTQTPKKFSAEIVITRLYHSLSTVLGDGWDLRVGVSGMPDDGSDAETLLSKAAI